MKLAIFNILLLAFSTLRATAMPSTVTSDSKSKDPKDDQLTIRAVDTGKAVEAQNLGPWAAVAVGAVVSYGFNKAADYLVDKYNYWKAHGKPSTMEQTILEVNAENGEDLMTLMTKFVTDTSNKMGPDVGILLIQQNAIMQDGLSGGYDWFPVALQTRPDVPGQYTAFELLYATQGFVNAFVIVDNFIQFQMKGAIGLQQTNAGTPNVYNTFYFGNRN